MSGSIRSAAVFFVLMFTAVPRASGGGFTLVPVHSDGIHVLNGNEIRIPGGGATVTLEIRTFGWDPDHNGQPLLRGYQATIDSSGFTSGTSGFLSTGAISCSTSADCPEGTVCLSTGVCSAEDHAFINEMDPDYVLAGLSGISVVDVSGPNYRYGATTVVAIEGAADAGEAKYAGTLRLDVSPDASGVFTVRFGPSPSLTFHVLPSGQGVAVSDLVPAVIVVAVGDCNLNDIPDFEEVHSGMSKDCNHNEIPDDCESDCNHNGQADECDISFGCTMDCNSDGVPDDCQADCNGNGSADECDVDAGVSPDCDHNFVPDECQPGYTLDCNGNGISDVCDIGAGTIADCNGNGIPDDCELARGTNNDCNQNGIPDDCEPDCNANGTADGCDIASGSSPDANHDGVPDECKTSVEWAPVDASTGHYVSANTIRLPAGGSRVTLEARISTWDPDENGDPGLRGYQLRLDSAGFTSGSTGSLSRANIACTSNDDCFGPSLCVAGVCDQEGPNYVDISHPNFVFLGEDVVWAVNPFTPNVLFGTVLTGPVETVADVGEAKYAATLILDVSSDAAGTFSVGFTQDPLETFFLLHFPGGGDVPIPIAEKKSAIIIILDDCNANGTPDNLDLTSGASQDCDANGFPDECDMLLAEEPDCNGNGLLDNCESPADCNVNGHLDLCDLFSGNSEDGNGNGVPDECELGSPAVLAMGGRSFEVEPAPGAMAVALRVTSPNHPCLVRYVVPVAGKGQLSNSPVYHSPAEWGRLLVTGTEITPNASYNVNAELTDGLASTAAQAVTARWGDIAEPYGTVTFADIVAVVDRFKGARCAVATALADLHPAIPNGVITFLDISLEVDAFKGKPYPYGSPCP